MSRASIGSEPPDRHDRSHWVPPRSPFPSTRYVRSTLSRTPLDEEPRYVKPISPSNPERFGSHEAAASYSRGEEAVTDFVRSAPFGDRYSHSAASAELTSNEDGQSQENIYSTPQESLSVIYDKRFKKLQLRDWRWFRPGRVFAIKMYDEEFSRSSEERDDFSVERVRTIRDTQMHEKIRRIIIVKAREGFCVAVPINTYGGRGLTKPGFRETNVNAHARVYMANREPVWLEGEPKTGKRDIVVEPEDEMQELHPASRICFERTHSIDYSEAIMKIGTVTRQCLEYLVTYWEEEIARPSGQGVRKLTSKLRDQDEGKYGNRYKGNQRVENAVTGLPGQFGKLAMSHQPSMTEEDRYRPTHVHKVETKERPLPLQRDSAPANRHFDIPFEKGKGKEPNPYGAHDQQEQQVQGDRDLMRESTLRQPSTFYDIARTVDRQVDPRFKALNTSEWKYFTVGRVFAIMTHSEDTSENAQDDSVSVRKIKTKDGYTILSRLRRMILVRECDNFGWAIPINTYENQGLRMKRLSQQSIDAHAIVYMSGTNPVLLEGEPQLSKRPIEIIPHDRSQKLVIASRINFEKPVSVEYNVKIMKVGTISKDSMPYFLEYWGATYVIVHSLLTRYGGLPPD